ncbi:hypothetical protein K437DRAFT_276091 [Tilletiaria anomala UBC 951]|uniref:DNA-directed RNA polymerase III subunit n=1 Tax=Tilletiaria anomala (strain ATCC 24038 / CBS 436.72 / UBC 951) TaxID=1037660 RepID=A0A066VK66_TILAU|nr:uncharacterized protein K437DRAFT_276091 [Tilletiaria anomala UBC 951]KDN39154.1 hypothetical protein K437DRAFT_276091 [Tilletiaria anomala UBC 951]
MSRGGRGGFRGGPRGMGGGAPMGDISFKELMEITKGSGELYPRIEMNFGLVEPTRRERRNAKAQLEFLRNQRFSPYWPSIEAPPSAGSTHRAPGTGKAPSARAVTSMKEIHLQKEVFPQGIWQAFMEGETKRVARAERQVKRQKQEIDWSQFEKKAVEGEPVDQAEISEPEEVDEYEDEQDDDYNQNYFDNGEDERDDLGDDMGGGDDGVYE